MREIVALNIKNGQHFFSEGAMKFFRSKLCEDAFQAKGSNFAYFVTSEMKPKRGAERRYTIRQIDISTGRIETYSEFQEYKTNILAWDRVLEITENEFIELSKCS